MVVVWLVAARGPRGNREACAPRRLAPFGIGGTTGHLDASCHLLAGAWLVGQFGENCARKP